MFIELSSKFNDRILIKIDTIQRILEDQEGTYIYFTGEEKSIVVKESYNSIRNAIYGLFDKGVIFPLKEE